MAAGVGSSRGNTPTVAAVMLEIIMVKDGNGAELQQFQMSSNSVFVAINSNCYKTAKAPPNVIYPPSMHKMLSTNN